jgi:hypothetical protein
MPKKPKTAPAESHQLTVIPPTPVIADPDLAKKVENVRRYRDCMGVSLTREGRRHITVDPDMLADFTALPFPDSTFTLVVFDPPHTFCGKNSWMRKKYGSLEADWRRQITNGFAECFRVLCPLGTLIFKWNEHRVPVSTVLSLTPEQPLFGQRCGTTAKTHWIVFMKPPNPENR